MSSYAARERNNRALKERKRQRAIMTQYSRLGHVDGTGNVNVPVCMIDERSEVMRKDLSARISAMRRMTGPQMSGVSQLEVQQAASNVCHLSGASASGRCTSLMPQQTSETWSLERFVPVVTGEGWVPWPERSEICCWHCCHAFDTVPVPAVAGADDKRGILKAVGNFCSWACSKAWMLDQRMDRYTMYLRSLYKKAGGEGVTIPRAPPRNTLRAFGGTLTIEQFRGQIEQLRWVPVTCSYTLQMRNMAHWGMGHKPREPSPPPDPPSSLPRAQKPAAPIKTSLNQGLVSHKPREKNTIDRFF